MKILVIALSGIGDALMFTPALQKLNDELPSAEIDALVMYNGVKDIYTGLPQLSNVIYFDFINSGILESINFVLGLRKKYDATISVYPSNRKEYNIINRMIGAEKRFAVRYLHNDFLNLGFLNTSRTTENNSLHNVEENIKMAEMLSGRKFEIIPPLQFNLNINDLSFADEFLRMNQIKANDLVVGFHPGCSPLKNHERRRWEPERFSELAKRLIEKFGAKILIFGGGDEQLLKEQICKGTDSANVVSVNASSLSAAAAVMKRCSLFISNDSSLMHVAAALKLNVVAIIGPTNVNYIYPWQTNYEIASLHLDCSPCFYYSPKPLTCSRKDLEFKCVRELSVDHVFEIAANQIRKLNQN